MAQIQAALNDIHGMLRWLILSLAVFGAARSFVRMLSVSARFTRLDLGVSRAYAALLDLQLLVGLLLVLAALTVQQPVPWIHPIITIPAVVVAHLRPPVCCPTRSETASSAARHLSGQSRAHRDRADRDRSSGSAALSYAAHHRLL